MIFTNIVGIILMAAMVYGGYKIINDYREWRIVMKYKQSATGWPSPRTFC